MAPVALPEQSYQWNKRVNGPPPLPDPPAGQPPAAPPEAYAQPAPGAYAQPAPEAYAQAAPETYAPAPESYVSAPPASAPSEPYATVPPPVAPPPMPAAPLVIPRSVPGFGYGPPPDDPRAGELTVWGLLVACLIAVGLPTLGFVVIRVLSIPAIGGTNWGLVLGLAAMSLTSAVVIGHLSSERRRRAGPLRAAAAAGLALASNAMLLQLVSTHPVKFGFDLSVLGLIPALLPIALAGWLAFTPPEDDR